ncbi:oxidoreductase [Jimgerdemannia flammicorona]|uniref:Oxidoreductase n=1 Tax=Jimgerdemannia flammicorona TaxID=994334 RepID=A0A433BAH5_9FUNG|nr:oxidoreductase [Jimgerdemannia flammicorona]
MPIQQTFLIGAICGSLRQNSYNMKLLMAAEKLAPAGVAFKYIDWSEIPIYNGDVEAAGEPPAVKKLKEDITAVDALLIATPEYNHSVPGECGGLKNAIDWASRPAAAAIFNAKTIALMSASPGSYPGAQGGARATATLRQIFVGLNSHVVNKSVAHAGIADGFDEVGRIKNQIIETNVRNMLVSLVRLTMQVRIPVDVVMTP